MTAKTLKECIQIGIDFAGRVTFEELVLAIQSGRFEIISVCRRRNRVPEYEVVLKVKF